MASLIRDASAARDELIALGPERIRDYEMARAPKVTLTGAG